MAFLDNILGTSGTKRYGWRDLVRQGQSGVSPTSFMEDQLANDPSYELPSSYEVHNGSVRARPEAWWKPWLKGAGLFGAAVTGGLALPGLLGGGGATAGGGASSGLLSSTPISGIAAAPAAAGAGNMAAAAGASGAASGLGGSMGGVFGFLSKLKAAGIDPTVLGLGALSSVIGGGDQKLTSFSKGGTSQQRQLTDPVNALYNALAASDRMMSGLNRNLQVGPTLRSSYLDNPPAPVNIPGLGFQIGGGLGTDPALKDQSLLNYPFAGGDLYQSLLGGGSGSRAPQGPPAQPRRRSPK